MAYLVTVRGVLKADDPEAARAAHDEVFERLSPKGKELGSTAHRTYLDPENPKEFLATDYWDSLEGLQAFSADPDTMGSLASLFEGPPSVTVWRATDWAGY